jgi:hypothetical protein
VELGVPPSSGWVELLIGPGSGWVERATDHGRLPQQGSRGRSSKGCSIDPINGPD